jgi:hypothetical protein
MSFQRKQDEVDGKPYAYFLRRAFYVVSEIVGPVTNYFLLMETADYLLLEDGSKIVLE